MIVCPYCGNTNDDGATTCKVCGASLSGAKFPTALGVGTKLQAGKYVIENVLGQGGFGITYKAKNAALGIPVVVKEYHPQGASRMGSSMRPPGTLTAQEFKEARARFADEARVVAQLTLNNPNPNIVRVYDVFTENDTEYYTMEFLDGKPLSKLIETHGPLSEAEVLTIARQIDGALEEVHGAGLLHRDIKPDNIMMVQRGAVLIDFGSARSITAPGKQSIIVTPGYAPLEQYASEAKRGPFTDIYALAATLFYALTGQEPVPATDRVSGTKQPTAREVNGKVSKGLSDVLERAMRMKIDERPQTARDFLNELERAVGGKGSAKPSQPAPTQRTSNTPARPAPMPVPPSNSPVQQPTPNVPVASQGANTPSSNNASNSIVLGLFVIFGAMIVLGQFGIVSRQVAVIGFYLVLLLAAYLLIQWLIFSKVGQFILMLIVVVGGVLYYAYTQGLFGP